jgi:SNF family Na+-dependent transporter
MADAERERWSGRMAFIMAAIGSAVGLGNLWRFPAQAFQNGGGAFFIPYFIALISAGFPLVIVEYALGQRYQGGAPKALEAVTRKFKWVGWFALFVGSIIVMYYVVVMGYAWHYTVGSLSLAWTDPVSHLQVKDGEAGDLDVREVPAEQIQVCLVGPNRQSRSRMQQMQEHRSDEERLPVFSPDELEELRANEEEKPPDERTYYVTLGENAGNYFNENVLGGFHPGLWGKQQLVRDLERKAAGEGPEAEEAAEKAASLREKLAPYRENMFELSPTLIVGTALTWVLIFLIIFRGVRNVGKVVMLTVPIPVVLLIVMLIRGMTLPGAATGILYYLRPNWDMLKEPTVWIHAYGQIFFSLTLGFGVLIAYASYMPEESDVTNSALITSFGNCVTSFIAGLAVFSVLGYMAHVQGTQVPEVVSAGPGLVFVTYPIALAEMPMAAWATAGLSIIFFLCLVTLGIDSAFSLVEGIVTGFRDHATHLSKSVLTAAFCGIGFIGSLFICTKSGLMWLDILDNWMSNYGLALVGLMECIAVGYFFHISELKDYINKHSEIKVHYWFDAFIRVVTPAILIVLLGQQFLEDITHTYGGYDAILTHSVNVAGWGVFFAIFILSLLAARHWKMLAWTASVLIVAGVAFLYFRAALPAAETGDVTAASFMCGIAVALLFGGVITGIHIARKTHHMAGLSLEAQDEDDGEG